MTTTYDIGALGTQSGHAKFPAVPHVQASSYYEAYFEEFARAASLIDPDAVDRVANILLEAYTTGATVFSCGNGGSAAIANHLHCDHLKGVRTGTDLAPRVVSLSSSIELLTAIANDRSYEEIFTYQLESQSSPGDVLVAISSSGCSPNIVSALRWAAANGLRTIAFTGFAGGEARLTADVAIHVDSANYGIVEDLHQAAMHAAAQYIRQSRMSAAAIAATTF
jgi:phosphoheptose isomerase